ncbi:MAG: NAD(+)/NADH kinase [Dehalococcoidia bacterium]|jgi:NAD+ kinase|nr:NAD(+)/NADH kinase [Dehalococcoidia bacterium]
MKNIGIIYNACIPEALELATTILKKLELPADSWISPAENLETLRERATETGLVVTVGGDGTILRAAQVTAPCAIPVVGINMGRLGFMTELRVHEALEKLPSYFDGIHRVEERNMLQAQVFKGGEGPGYQTEGPFHALNDAVMARGMASRLVTITVHIDGAQLTTFRADAVILSTATGSTGYSLAAGGPILDPASEALVLKPVAAHLGLSAGLILDPSVKVTLSLEGHQQAILSVDGYVENPLEAGDRVELKQSPYKARFLRANPPSHFYGTLRRRLGLGVSGQEGTPAR